MPGETRLSGRDSNDLRHLRRRSNGRQLDPPQTISMTISGDGSGLERQPRLPCAARTRQRHQPLASDELDDGLLLSFPTDERRQRDRQVVRGAVERSQRRERRSEVGVDELKDLLGARQITEPRRPQRNEIHARRQHITDQHRRRLREQDLTTMPAGPQSRAARDRPADVVPVVSELRLARVDRHPHQQPRELVLQPALGLNRGPDRLGGSC